jgi:cytosine/uracil/thiamine/allantoin permease
MQTGTKRTTMARIAVALSFVCGIIGLLAGLTDHTWKLWSVGWFTGGMLLALIAVFILLDGHIAHQRSATR